jgi:hypothetical protein
MNAHVKLAVMFLLFATGRGVTAGRLPRAP